jgi:hypothetical protein
MIGSFLQADVRTNVVEEDSCICIQWASNDARSVDDFCVGCRTFCTTTFSDFEKQLPSSRSELWSQLSLLATAMRYHPARLGLVVVLGGADSCNVVAWGRNNQRGYILKCRIWSAAFVVWLSEVLHGEADKRWGDGVVLVLVLVPFLAFTACYIFSVEWQIVVRRACILFGLVIINLWRQVWQICR